MFTSGEIIYAYVNGNPVNAVDPTGEDAITDSAKLGWNLGTPLGIPGKIGGAVIGAGIGYAAANAISGGGSTSNPSRDIWQPDKKAGLWVCKARADCNDNIPGNCPDNSKQRFAFGGGEDKDLGFARNIAKNNATSNLMCQPKHVSCKCTGPKGDTYSGGC